MLSIFNEIGIFFNISALFSNGNINNFIRFDSNEFSMKVRFSNGTELPENSVRFG